MNNESFLQSWRMRSTKDIMLVLGEFARFTHYALLMEFVLIMSWDTVWLISVFSPRSYPSPIPSISLSPLFNFNRWEVPMTPQGAFSVFSNNLITGPHPNTFFVIYGECYNIAEGLASILFRYISRCPPYFGPFSKWYVLLSSYSFRKLDTIYRLASVNARDDMDSGSF